jgi:CRP/FNR family transcriptional regulator, cyclic AMP receptor protein
MSATRPAIRLLDALPELGSGLDQEQRTLAYRHFVAPLETLEAGTWRARVGRDRSAGALGMIVVEGLLTRDVVIADTVATELVGRGDLLRPLDHDGELAPVPFGVNWTVVQRTRIAILDERSSALACRWPPIVSTLLGLAVNRSRALALHLAISNMRRVDARLLALLWHLADRWGHVSPDGVHIPLRLTHATLGRLVGAQRPSVTTALKGLGDAGRLSRGETQQWVLHGEPPEELPQMMRADERPAG